MKVLTYDSEAEWLEGREPCITSTKLKDIVSTRGTAKKVGFYQLAAARLAIDEDSDEDPMDRGHRLEKEAIELLSQETGKKFIHSNLELWKSDENEYIACSPDGYTKDLTIAAEVKALKAALHIQAWHTQKVPTEYKLQSIQPFIVNKKLKKLYFTFIDPRVSAKPFFYIEINRKDIQADIDKYEEYQLKELQEVDDLVAQLAF